MDSLLSWIVFLPIIGALGCLIVPRPMIRVIAVVATLLTLLLSLTLFGTFLGGGDPDQATEVFGSAYGHLHHVQRFPWITGDSFTIEYYLGMDGLSFPLFILTTLVSFLACVASWNFDKWKISRGPRADFILLLLLETGKLGGVVSLDVFLL